MDHIWIIIGLYMDYLRHRGDIPVMPGWTNKPTYSTCPLNKVYFRLCGGNRQNRKSDIPCFGYENAG